VGSGGAPDAQDLRQLTSAIELIHAFALVHDDVMDDADRRRGVTTVHTLAAAQHAANGWRGESRRFGEGIAIVAGDLLQVLADRLMVGMPAAVTESWHEMQIEVDIGQWLDLIAAAESTLDAELAARVTELKSARYSAVRPLQLGALLANATPDIVASMEAVGLPLGVAFQHRDDLLGVLGSPDAVGKPVGADLRAGKLTHLTISARSRITAPEDVAAFDRIGAPDLLDEETEQLVELLHRVGAVRDVEATIERLVSESCVAIESSGLSRSARVSLTEIAHFAGHRFT